MPLAPLLLLPLWEKSPGFYCHCGVLGYNLMPLEDYDPAAASELSQGQHNVIYLVLRVLAAPSGATVVIDEPELHLNPALIQSYISLIYQAVTVY
jgi:ABC-type branched-subunit amino acid transport system ATPase component